LSLAVIFYSIYLKLKMIKKLPIKNNILFTTALTTSLFGYYKKSYADCNNSVSGNQAYLCSGTNSATQAINYSGANVSTVDGFSVTAASGDGVTISGDGDVIFADSFNSTISGASGIYLVSTGSSNLTSNGTTTALAGDGVRIKHTGTGALQAVINGGTITSDTSKGLNIQGSNGSDATITISSGSVIQSSNNGVNVDLTNWANDLTMEINGDMDGGYHGLRLSRESFGDSSVTIGEESYIHGYQRGIDFNSTNSASDTVVINGDATGDNKEGARLFQEAPDGNTYLTIGETSTLQGNYSGLYALVKSVNSTITINGDIIGGNDGFRIRQTNTDGDSITNVLVSETSSIQAERGSGIRILTRETKTTSVDVRGDIVAGEFGIQVYHPVQVWDESTVNITIQNGATIYATKAISHVVKNPDWDGFGIPEDSVINVILDGSSEAIFLTGTSGTAIDLGEEDDSLIITGTVNISGNVYGGDDSDTLTIYDTYLTLTNGTLSGFEIVSITGNNTLIGDFDFGDSADLVTEDGSGLDLTENIITTNSVQIASNSTLSGNGTLLLNNDLTIQSGGILAPGNSTGTINVTGNTILESGSNFNVEIEPTSTDLVNVTGNVTIESGSNLNISSSLGENSGSWTFLTASGSIDGSFNNTSNIGSSIIGTNSSIQSLSAVTLNRKVLDSTLQSSLNNSILFNDTLNDQIATGSFVKGSNFWIRNINRNRNVSAGENNLGFDSKANGFALGSQMDVKDNANYKLGFALSSIFNRDKLKSDLGSASSDSFFASIYGIANRDLINNYKGLNSKLFTSLALGFGYHDNDTSRVVYNEGAKS
jgi:hypothetical protein